MKPILAASLLLFSTASPLTAALPGAEALGKLITSELDTNSDKSIDSGEWQSGIEGGFEEFDGNGDGSLTEGEIDTGSRSVAGKEGDATAAVLSLLIKQVLVSLDKNKDKTVTHAEYTEEATAMFKKVDADADGKLSQAELAELPAKILGL